MSEEVKQGSVTTMVSTGTKKDSEQNIEGSQANPVMEKEMLQPRSFATGDFSKVGLTFGITKSLGNFEFLRMDVTIEDYCKPENKLEALEAINALASEYAVKCVKNGLEYLKQKDIAKGSK